MRRLIRRSENKTWPVVSGPVVVSAPDNFMNNNTMINIIRRFAGNRDGPLIFHMRDGPPRVNGPPGGTGPPEIFPVEQVRQKQQARLWSGWLKRKI